MHICGYYANIRPFSTDFTCQYINLIPVNWYKTPTLWVKLCRQTPNQVLSPDVRRRRRRRIGCRSTGSTVDVDHQPWDKLMSVTFLQSTPDRLLSFTGGFTGYIHHWPGYIKEHTNTKHTQIRSDLTTTAHERRENPRSKHAVTADLLH